MKSPTPEEIKKAREAAGLTQRECAELVHASLQGWQKWEYGTRGMHPAIWELFLLKAGRKAGKAMPRRAGTLRGI